MIYYFGTGENVSVVFQGKYLTNSEKKEATLIVNSETPAEEKEGHYAVRYIDPETKEFSWIYKEIKKEEELV